MRASWARLLDSPIPRRDQGEFVIHPGVFKGCFAIGYPAFLQSVYDSWEFFVADPRIFDKGGMIGHEEKIRIVIQAVASVLNIGADTVYDDNIAAERKVGLHFRAVMIVKVTDIVWGVVGGTESAKEFPVTKTACIALDGTVFMQQGGIFFQSPPAAYRRRA